jgi:hypothetical protein
MAMDAEVIPTDWIIIEKSLAPLGSMLNPRVITGKATAPPPWLVDPATKEPNAIVTDMNQFSTNRAQRAPKLMKIAQRIQTAKMKQRSR